MCTMYICQSRSPSLSLPTSPSQPLVAVSLFATSVTLFLLSQSVNLYHLFGFHIQAMLNNVFSLSVSLHPDSF